MSNKLYSALIFGLGLGAASLANAGFAGNTVKVEHLFPDYATVDIGGTATNTTTPGAGAEFTHPAGVYSVDVTDTNISFDFLTSGTWNTPFTFNGFHLMDVNGTIDAISAVAVAAVSWAGFSNSRITRDDNNIWVDMQGLAFDANTSLSLDVTFGDIITPPPGGGGTVPEPATLALLGLGLLGLGALRRKV